MGIQGISSAPTHLTTLEDARLPEPTTGLPATPATPGSGGAPAEVTMSDTLIAARFGLPDPATPTADERGGGWWDSIKEAIEKAIDAVQKAAEAARPYGPFDTPEQAARAALTDANPRSIADNREYGGVIYKDADGKYWAAKPNGGDGDSVSYDPSTIPDGAEWVGTYHCHAAYSVAGSDGEPQRTDDPGRDDYNSDNFSQTDINNTHNRAQGKSEFHSYLGTPSGQFKEYDPSTRQITNL